LALLRLSRECLPDDILHSIAVEAGHHGRPAGSPSMNSLPCLISSTILILQPPGVLTQVSRWAVPLLSTVCSFPCESVTTREKLCVVMTKASSPVTLIGWLAPRVARPSPVPRRIEVAVRKADASSVRLGLAKRPSRTGCVYLLNTFCVSAPIQKSCDTEALT
jgi:hypothetical protein